MSSNNRAWSEVALKPTETFAPKPPEMQGVDPTGALIGLAGGIGSAVFGGLAKKPPDAYPGAKGGSNSWGGSGASHFKTDLTIPGINYGASSQWGNGFNFGSKAYQQ
jgi:hypothetical protein